MLGEFRTGLYVSVAGHVSLLLWLLIGGLFIARDAEPLDAAAVSILSEEEFSALLPSSPEAATDAPEPEQPQSEAAPDLTPPAEDPAPLRDQASLQSPASSANTPPRPEPVPQPQPEPEPQPSLEPETTLDPGPEAAPEIDEDATPTPEAAPRVAEEAAPEPEPEIEQADEAQAETAPSPEAAEIEDAQEETAPEAATTEIVTEAEEQPSAAPLASTRPTARPARPARPQVAETEEQPAPAAADDPWDALESAVSDAVSDALTDAPETASAAEVPRGPPLTGGEKDSFRSQINKCWSVGSLSTEALQVVVTVGFNMQPDGRPDFGSLRLVSSSGGSGSAVDIAFRTARSAIIVCGQQGYDLPRDKYDQWAEVEVTFDATKRQIR